MDITPEPDDLVAINNSIRVRHDCVHRNGRDKESDQINVIDRPQIEQLIRSISKMADKINKALLFL